MSVADSSFVPTAEAAFIAGLSDREMNRVVDEHILPDELVRSENGRRFSRLGAAFASFYFATEDQFAASLRKNVLRELTLRLHRHQDWHVYFALPKDVVNLDWHVQVPHAHIDLTHFIVLAWNRVSEVERANSLVQVRPDVMGGQPVFSGTRVPIDVVTASLDSGIELTRLKASYPFLTDAHIDAARVYAKVHPRKGRPRRLSEQHPDWKLKSHRVVRPASAA